MLESSPVAPALAGLRANEARYFHNKYDHAFTVVPASADPTTLAWVTDFLDTERGIVISSPALELAGCDVDGIHGVHVFYESGLPVSVLYTLDDAGKRAVWFKLSEGMDVPEELSGFKFARQKSKLAGTVSGAYFVTKGEDPPTAFRRIPEKLRAAHWKGYEAALARGATAGGRRARLTRGLHRDPHRTVYVEMTFALVTVAGQVARDVTERHLREREERRAQAGARSPVAGSSAAPAS